MKVEFTCIIQFDDIESRRGTSDKFTVIGTIEEIKEYMSVTMERLYQRHVKEGKS